MSTIASHRTCTAQLWLCHRTTADVAARLPLFHQAHCPTLRKICLNAAQRGTVEPAELLDESAAQHSEAHDSDCSSAAPHIPVLLQQVTSVASWAALVALPITVSLFSFACELSKLWH